MERADEDCEHSEECILGTAEHESDHEEGGEHEGAECGQEEAVWVRNGVQSGPRVIRQQRVSRRTLMFPYLLKPLGSG